MIVNVYGGPESQEVDERWSVDWKDFLVTNYDIVYAAIDGRGTGFQVPFPVSSCDSYNIL